jgi:hypothetical protein
LESGTRKCDSAQSIAKKNSIKSTAKNKNLKENGENLVLERGPQKKKKIERGPGKCGSEQRATEI